MGATQILVEGNEAMKTVRVVEPPSGEGAGALLTMSGRFCGESFASGLVKWYMVVATAGAEVGLAREAPAAAAVEKEKEEG